MSPSISGNMYKTEVALQITGTGITGTPHGKKKTSSFWSPNVNEKIAIYTYTSQAYERTTCIKNGNFKT